MRERTKSYPFRTPDTEITPQHNNNCNSPTRGQKKRRRAVRERFGVRGGGHLGRLLAQERHESDERAATGADAPAWRVAVHAEGDRLRVQALRNAQERR